MTNIIDNQVVDDALSAILADEKFQAAPQMSAFLKYVVEQTLLGQSSRIKAYTVAVDALGKPVTFDPQNDPSVRVLAKRLRSSLDSYYERNTDTKLIIAMKAGSYVPNFVHNTQVSEPSARHDEADSASERPVLGSTTYERQITQVKTSNPLPHKIASEKPAFGDAAANQPTADKAGESVHRQATDNSTEIVNSEKKQTATAIVPRAGRTESTKDGWSLFKHIPRPVVAMSILGAAIWAFAGDNPEKHSGAALTTAANSAQATSSENSVTTPIRVDIQQSQPRVRPEIPTIFIASNWVDSKLDAQLVSTVSDVFSRFDHFQVHRSNSASEIGQYWPEEYQIVLNSMSVGNNTRVTVELMHAQTGRVLHTESLRLSGSANEFLSIKEQESIEETTARLVQRDGLLMNDYKEQADLTAAMTCYFGVHDVVDATQELGSASTDANTSSKQSPDNKLSQSVLKLCDKQFAKNGTDAGDAQALLHESALQIAYAGQQSGKQRDSSIKKAIKLGKQAVTLSPFSADAHLTLMRAYQIAGNLTTAATHANHSLKLNPFDGYALRVVSELMTVTNKRQRSDELRVQASRFDAFPQLAQAE